ncbi:MAG: Scr1 family TA system antitoxin-like transcriptional regulator [Pseudonocardiaceae bacterium]
MTLRVVPLAAGVHAGLRGPFVILEFAEEPTLVFVENRSTRLFLAERPIWRPTGGPRRAA